MPLEPGALDDNDDFINPDCMARYIDDFMVSHTPPLPANTPPDVLKNVKHGQRTLWIGIATGVIQYLKAHAGDSFQITITASPSGDKATLTIL
jgi:hypothetical protein